MGDAIVGGSDGRFACIRMILARLCNGPHTLMPFQKGVGPIIGVVYAVMAYQRQCIAAAAAGLMVVPQPGSRSDHQGTALTETTAAVALRA